jgi:hypothetical protein
MVSAPALSPALALEYLGQLSVDIKESVLLRGDGSLAAATRSGGDGERLRALTLELFERADAADEEGVAQVEVSTGAGAVYAAREGPWTVAVVAGRLALPSLMFYDLRMVLGDLEGEPA